MSTPVALALVIAVSALAIAWSYWRYEAKYARLEQAYLDSVAASVGRPVRAVVTVMSAGTVGETYRGIATATAILSIPMSALALTDDGIVTVVAVRRDPDGTAHVGPPIAQWPRSSVTISVRNRLLTKQLTVAAQDGSSTATVEVSRDPMGSGHRHLAALLATSGPTTGSPPSPAA